jgi:hypothetical protein
VGRYTAQAAPAWAGPLCVGLRVVTVLEGSAEDATGAVWADTLGRQPHPYRHGLVHPIAHRLTPTPLPHAVPQRHPHCHGYT